MLHLFAHLTPPLVELTSDAHHASCDWLLQWKRTILDELLFFFSLHLPTLQKVHFTVFVICSQTRDSLDCTVRKNSSLTRLKHLAASQSAKNAFEQHLREILSTPSLCSRSVAFMF